jgi:hypothetical protein
MIVEITKSQYKRLIYKLLDTLYGPKISYKWNNDLIEILSNEGDEIFYVYTKLGRGRGCKKDMYVITQTEEEIHDFIPKATTRKKLFSKTVLSYVNEKTGLDIDCIEFWSPAITRGIEHNKKYNFNVKKNKKTKVK